MKNKLLVGALLLGGLRLSAQTAVPVGAGSYASFPPGAAAAGTLHNFVYDKPLYVARSVRKQHLPIPTND